MPLAHAFRATVSEHPDRVAVRIKDDEIAWTWGELAERVEQIEKFTLVEPVGCPAATSSRPP